MARTGHVLWGSRTHRGARGAPELARWNHDLAASSPLGLEPLGLESFWPPTPVASSPPGLTAPRAGAAASPGAPELPGEGHRARGPRGSGGGREAVKIVAEEKEEKEERRRRRRGGEELS